MAKRKETLEIEEKLHQLCRKKRWYGCEEVTIGFANNGHGDEIVDFCSMDYKGIIRCYEIKVTLADLKSKAKKSWFGHYNYLFVTDELYQKIKECLDEFIPDYVGVSISCSASWSSGVEVKRKAVKQEVSAEQREMMKESLVRSMYYKMQKYKDSADLEKVSALKKEARTWEKERDKYCKEYNDTYYVLEKTERILRKYYGFGIDLEDFVKKFDNEEILLPEQIAFSLTERGEKRNQMIKEENENL